MKKRFSIWVREYGSDHDVELMEVDSNPQPIVTGLYAKTLNIGKRKHAKYTHVRIVDNHARA
jgi:hypothetical protein